ncbi:hypothetical protein [Shewanella fidelis]|uniref:Uncharacterized protein n=1 Tax=Shewanella fidelis TaxID=173509 RepID=A0AAW8NRV6_9GAMM|nr:hypothetical protein [Shewanella fidelis]MDR8525652.1 hypothetical protein [Shewanella fidelis]MDW4812838.1 hypothetical protein [Shewanella fidelis]MDW4816586.1 hypothetical protein [Shewanella fidelis]MDW4820250.1 hypothetical protein [Shewanella fidelis]MDW4825303.1 hypothetical protein [Shewanella fidelis]
MNPATRIQDKVLSPFTRSMFQKASLVIGLILLLGACFYDAQAISLVLTAIATLYVTISFVFKPKLRQQIYLKDDALRVLKSAQISGFDKWVFACFVLLTAASNIYALANISTLLLVIVAYQVCLSVWVYKRLQRQDELVLLLDEQYLLLENKQSNCLLLQRFDIYLLNPSAEIISQPVDEDLAQSEVKQRQLEFVGTISLEEDPFEGDDAKAVVEQLSQYLSITSGYTLTRKSWRDGLKVFPFSLAGLYAYVFWLPDLFKFMFPVGRYRNKFGDIVIRTEGMSDFGVVFMMCIMFVFLAMPCLAFIFTFCSEVRFGTFKAVCVTKEQLWLLTPSINGHDSRNISCAEIAYISHADVQAGKDDVGPPVLYIDGDIKLIGVDSNLISLSGCAWSGRYILNHLVKLGVPLRLVAQECQPSVE